MMVETWRSIPEWPDYEVSDQGRVRRAVPSLGPTYVGKILKGAPDKDGYLVVTLRSNGHQRVRRIHSLVLEAFVGPRKEGEEARHLDGKSTNNVLINLCWGTALQNQRDRITHGTSNRGSLHGQAKLSENDIAEIRSRYRPWVVSLPMLAKEYGVCVATIARIVNRQSWTHI